MQKLILAQASRGLESVMPGTARGKQQAWLLWQEVESSHFEPRALKREAEGVDYK